MLILLPPSEGKAAPVRGRPLGLDRLSLPQLQDSRAKVLDALVTLCTTDRPAGPEEAVRVLGLGSTQSDEVTRNQGLAEAPTARADKVYSGVLYEALGLSTLDGPARRRATSWLAIISALFGVVRPTDRIPAYRLSGDTTLPGVGNVATYWRSRLAPVVPDLTRGLVVDLRSSTYAGFWRPDPVTAKRVVTIRVLHEVHGRRTVVSHFNKATKGRLVRDLLEDGGRPGSPKAFARHLEALGWDVEPGAPGRNGTSLDVVVTDL